MMSQDTGRMPKGKGLGRVGPKGGIRRIRGIIISTHNVVGGTGKAV